MSNSSSHQRGSTGDNSQKLCQQCGRSSKEPGVTMKRCSLCQAKGISTHYCSKECQKLDWNVHRGISHGDYNQAKESQDRGVMKISQKELRKWADFHNMIIHDLARQAFDWSPTKLTPPILCIDLVLPDSSSKRKRTLELKHVGPPSTKELPELEHILSQCKDVSGIVSVQLPAVRAIVPVPLSKATSRDDSGALNWPMVKWYLIFGSVVSQGGQTPADLRERMTGMILGAQLWCNFFRHESVHCDCRGALELVGTLGTPPIGDYPWWWLEYPPFTQWYYDKYGRDPLDRFNELPASEPIVALIRQWLTSEDNPQRHRPRLPMKLVPRPS